MGKRWMEFWLHGDKSSAANIFEDQGIDYDSTAMDELRYCCGEIIFKLLVDDETGEYSIHEIQDGNKRYKVVEVKNETE